MNFNLNDEKYNGGVAVFNNGNAGKVENVEISVEKKQAHDMDSAPDYKLIVKDSSGGAPINQGFYLNVEGEDKQGQNIQRIRSIAQSIVPEGFVYPEVNSYEEAVNTLFKIIKENSEGKKVNVFTTYGYEGSNGKPGKVSKFLGLRYFNFIERPGVGFSRLTPSNTDILERPVADAPKNQVAERQTSGNGSAEDLLW